MKLEKIASEDPRTISLTPGAMIWRYGYGLIAIAGQELQPPWDSYFHCI